MAMALSLPASHSRSLVLTLTYFVVVFSILVQGLTVGRVIRMTSGPAHVVRRGAHLARRFAGALRRRTHDARL